VAGDLELVVVGFGDGGVELLARHAEAVVVGVGAGGVAAGVGLHPLDAVLGELAHGGARLDGSVDEEDEAFHAELQVVGIPVHQSAGAADLAAGGGHAGAGAEVLLDRLLEPDVDVVEAAAAARGGVAAFERELGVRGGEQGDVLDRVLDVEIREFGDVEVGGVEVGFDEAGHDGAFLGIHDHRVRGMRGVPAGRGRRTGSARP
jgi:hypothetical protein